MSPKSFFINGPINPQFIADQIANHSAKHEIGGHAIFLGQVRADEHKGNKVESIEYTAYREMADNEINKIRENAFSKRPINCLHIFHSLGQVKVGDISLFIFVSAAHRNEAINGMQEIVEDLKYKVPIWKQEIFQDQTKRWVK